MKFDKYVRTQSTVTKTCNELIGKKPENNREFEKLFSFFGSARIASNSIIKGHVRSSMEKMKQHLRSIAHVVMIDEFWTSRLCSRLLIFNKAHFNFLGKSLILISEQLSARVFKFFFSEMYFIVQYTLSSIHTKHQFGSLYESFHTKKSLGSSNDKIEQ